MDWTFTRWMHPCVAVIAYLDKVDGDMAKLARERYGKLMAWAETPRDHEPETVASAFGG